MIITQTVGFIGDKSASIAISFETQSKKKSDAAPPRATSINPQEYNTDLSVAFWGGDNQYPQHVTEQLSTSGVARSALDFKARALFGEGIVWGKITGVDDKGNDIFTPAQRGEYPQIEQFFRENNDFYRFYLEFNQDWVHFGNCFPELILSNDRTKIVKIVHQESSDCRYKQMNTAGYSDTIYLSKFWGDISEQFLKSSPEDTVTARPKQRKKLPKEEVDNEVVKELPTIDMYDDLNSLNELLNSNDKIKSFILPVNYPSPGKTYYQSPIWDAVRLSGWLEIASKVPEMLKALYNNAFNIKYHIQIPETYFSKNIKDWKSLDADAQLAHKQELLDNLEKFLSGVKNKYKSMITFFDVNPIDGKENGLVKITEIPNNSTLDKELLLSSATNQEILFALQINPNLIGAGAPGGAYTGGAGSGSDIREAFLVYCALLHLERQIILEPIKLAHRYNGFPEDVVYRFRNIKLVTLDQNSGTEKVIS